MKVSSQPRLTRVIAAIVLSCLLRTLSISQSLSQTPQPLQSQPFKIDIPSLVQACIKNGIKYNTESVQNYTFTRKTITHYSVGTAVKEEEIYPTNGRVSQKLVSLNGRTVSKGTDEKEQKRVADELERDAAEKEKQAASGNETANIIRYGFYEKFMVSILDFLAVSEFSSARMEHYQDRDMLVLDFKPRPDFHPEDISQYPVSHLQGTIWIDPVANLPMRVEAWPQSGNSKSAKPGVSSVKKDRPVIMEYQLLPDGMWAIRLAQFDTTRHQNIFNNLNYYITIEYNNYKRFATTIEDPVIIDPKSKKKP